MQVLVVGATGFLGGQIALELQERGYTVRGFVRGGEAHPGAAQLSRSGIEIVEGDLTLPESVPPACKGIDAVVCTATSMPHARDNGLVRVDLEGVSSLIRAAEKAGVSKFVYTSYSGNIRYDSPLEVAKRTCESVLLNSAMSAVILRPSYFMEMWLSPALGFDPLNGTARIYGSGKGKVSYVSAQDVASFAVEAVQRDVSLDQIVEIGGPEPISQLEAVAIFENSCKTKLRLEFVSQETLQTQHRSPDLLQKTFGALMLGYADGDIVAEAASNAKKFGIELRSVADYASWLFADQKKEIANARTA